MRDTYFRARPLDGGAGIEINPVKYRDGMASCKTHL
jgi:hypothetical protein